MAMERKYMFNSDISPDGCHGVHCDFSLTLGESQLKNAWFLLVCGWNLVWGYNKDESRRHQLRDLMKAVHHNKTPTDLPLFQAWASPIIAAMKALKMDVDPNKPEESALQYMKTRSNQWGEKDLGSNSHLPKYAIFSLVIFSVEGSAFARPGTQGAGLVGRV